MGVAYVIGGSLAISIYGEPRSTNDIAVVVLRKLEWYRRGIEQSNRQWRDVIAIVRQQVERLDRDRLERWAEYLNVADLLRRALEHG